MALQTFAPSIAPSPAGTITPQVNLRTAEFGDGYTQAGPAGLNHIREVVALKWNGITPAQREELEAFFRAHGGYKAFLYQPYGFATPVRWTCKEWSSTTKTPQTFTAKLRQDFSF
ncbi:phage tail protein [Thalassorhabdomicrobium marinisediminis]|uniref:Phage tail protein n=1 Tax=Thalassorhabdomicrobium marinisediminis TaxID=2170577 RepID=A0A2T7FVC9_9RHOB|nr:phage tail protein [Thalassorhabdomicrobium marinisediminis]PVA06108.1 phage tail protein [Thalassorhabdomicrobium marinisediminis]